jgi:Phage integrase family
MVPRQAGIVTGFEHVCRRYGCGFVQSASHGELRRGAKDGRKLWPKAQVRPIRWHDLRHTTASLLKAAGVHLVDAQRILRHSDPRITEEVYTHVDLEQLRSAVNRMPVRIDNFPANVDGGEGKNWRRKNVTTTEFSRSGKWDLNCRKAWKYPNEYDGLSAKPPRRFKSSSLACHLIPLQTSRFRSGTAHRHHMKCAIRKATTSPRRRACTSALPSPKMPSTALPGYSSRSNASSTASSLRSIRGTRPRWSQHFWASYRTCSLSRLPADTSEAANVALEFLLGAKFALETTQRILRDTDTP